MDKYLLKHGINIFDFIIKSLGLPNPIGNSKEFITLIQEQKLQKLIKNIEKELSTEKIQEFIKNASNDEKQQLLNILIKATDTTSEIEIYFLAKILIYQIKNNKLDYFHGTLLKALNILDQEDYKIINTLQKSDKDSNNKLSNKNKMEMICIDSNCYIRTINEEDFNYVNIFIQKMMSLGFFTNTLVVGGAPAKENNKSYTFVKTNFFEKLKQYVDEYFAS